METGPAREAVRRTYPSAVAWELDAGDRPYRPDGWAVLAMIALGFGIGFLSTGLFAVVGAILAVAGSVALWARFRPACLKDPIFRGGRGSWVRISGRRDLLRMALSQASALATGFGLGGVVVLLFVQDQPAWGIGLLAAAAISFLFTMLVFRRIELRESGG